MDKELTPLLEIVELQNAYDIYLIEEFFKLSSGRGYGMSGPLPLSYPDIKAYCELTGTQFSEWEVMTIKHIDQSFISANGSVQQEEGRTE